jgi:hypothetical protein
MRTPGWSLTDSEAVALSRTCPGDLQPEVTAGIAGWRRGWAEAAPKT